MAAYWTFCLLCALITGFDLNVIQINAINAFINALVNNKVYLIPPKGIDLLPGFFFCLKKAIYRLQKSPKLWFLEMSTALQSMGLKAVLDKPYLYVYPTKPIFVFFYINDILIIRHLSYRQQIEDILKQLQDQFKIRQIPQFTSFLNTRVVRDRQKGKLQLCLDQYLKKLVLIYYLEYLKLLAILLSGQELTPYKGEATLNQIKGY